MVTKEKALSTKPNIQTVNTFPIEGISWKTLKDNVNKMNAELHEAKREKLTYAESMRATDDVTGEAHNEFYIN